MKRLVMTLAVCCAVATAGCAIPTSAKGCGGAAGQVTICLGGKPVDFSGQQLVPHMHEAIYAPVQPLAKALGIEVKVDVKAKTVLINGKPFTPPSSEQVKGIHVHDGIVFVPVKEFVEAAGLKVKVNVTKGSIEIDR